MITLPARYLRLTMHTSSPCVQWELSAYFRYGNFEALQAQRRSRKIRLVVCSNLCLLLNRDMQSLSINAHGLHASLMVTGIAAGLTHVQAGCNALQTTKVVVRVG